MTSATFADDGRAVIEQSIKVHSSSFSSFTNIPSIEKLRKLYDVDKTIQLVREHDYKSIALQFPDELLHISTLIANELRTETEKDIFILADTSYGSCCVDEIAAEHVLADFLVHYGRACLSLTRRLPVQYAFGQGYIDVNDLVSKLSGLFEGDAEKHVLVMYDVLYHYCIESIKQYMDISKFPNLIISKLETDRMVSVDCENTRQPYSLKKNANLIDSTIFYIGAESLKLTNIIITHPSCTVIAYNPDTKECQMQSSQVNRLLRRRYYMLQKAKDSDVFGIVVGTLGVASYLTVISSLKSLIHSRSKKSYTLAVGKLNPAKLGNFLEIECFVVVACPENSLIDSREFLRPIVTPFELELALSNDREGEWVGKNLAYVTNLEEMSAKLELNSNFNSKNSYNTRSVDGESEDDEPHFSLVTGRYRRSKKYGNFNYSIAGEDCINSNALTVRNQNTSLTVNSGTSAAMDFLHQRTYQGLDAHIGQIEVSNTIVEGRSGIAKGYAGEGKDVEGKISRF